jgi:hypothetical protein
VYSNIFDHLLLEGRDGIVVVLDDTCGNTMSFKLNGGKAKLLGYEDLHDPEFDNHESYEPNIEMYKKDIDGLYIDGLCVHDLHVYPSSKFRESFESTTRYIYAGVVTLAFVVTAILLVVYDMMVNRRESKTIKAAARTQAIVVSLFPKDIAKKLVQEAVEGTCDSKENGWKKKQQDGKTGIQKMFAEDGGGLNNSNGRMLGSSKPLADLFPEATIMFGDLVGFTAWSSMREPCQVFMLLEGLYSTFDELALRRKVFKVETGKLVLSWVLPFISAKYF